MARTVVTALLLQIALPLCAAEPVGTQALDLGYLPQLRLGWARLASSTDPAGGNADRGWYQRREGAAAVLLDTQGPGMLTRIWSANPQGTLAIYFDGEAKPRVKLPFDRLAHETASTPTLPGFVSSAGGGVSCWFPMPYQRSVKVTVEGAEQLYYQVDYTTWPDRVKVKTFTPGAWQASGGMDWGEPAATRVTVPPGASRTLFDLQGPATIRRLVLSLSPTAYDALRPLVLRMRWDGAAPSVDVPLLDFFASGFGAAQYLSAPMAVAEWGFFTLDFPLPFAARGVGELVNRGGATVTAEATTYATRGRRDSDGYLHAAYRASTTVAGRPHRVAEVRGAGQYVGTAVALAGDADLKFLEGDEQIQVDDKLKLCGTGTEDYFDGAWYFRNGPYADIFAGAPLLAARDTRVAAYRWHVADCIPFRRHLVVDLEHGGRNDAPGALYRTVGYWYGATPQAVPAATPPARPGAFSDGGPGDTFVEGETLKDQAKGDAVQVNVVDDRDAPLPASGGKLLRVRFGSPKGGSVGLPFELSESGCYEVTLHLAAGGPTFQVEADVDGHALPAPVVQASLGEPELLLGRGRVEAGKHVLTVAAKAFAGGKADGVLGIDYLTFRPIGKVKGVLEAEGLSTKAAGRDTAVVVQTDQDLPAGAVRSGALVGGAVPGEAMWSGGAQVRFTPGQVGDTLTLTFPVRDDGDYGLSSSFTRGPEYGSCEVLLDGELLLGGADAEADNQSTDEIGARTPLGTHRLKAGNHTLTLRAAATKAGQVRPVGLDSLVVAPTTGGQEAELMRTAYHGAVTELRFGAEPRWSGGAFVRVPDAGGQAGGGYLFEAPRTGRYELTVKEARVPGGGAFDVALNGRPAGKIECSGQAEALGQGVTFTARLHRGRNRLSFKGSGDLALDVVSLEYVGGGLPLMPIGGGVALVLVVLIARRKRASR
ncbi:MAG: DUF2961 domain-containing protein [Armatimonadetes bacterium]|nr:DUF2961 domain-containing protein [Armatimonadota bacterium]